MLQNLTKILKKLTRYFDEALIQYMNHICMSKIKKT